jgi:archaellum biogenesis ATPase FlaH
MKSSLTQKLVFVLLSGTLERIYNTTQPTEREKIKTSTAVSWGLGAVVVVVRARSSSHE